MAIGVVRSTTNYGGRYIPRPPLPKPRMRLRHGVWGCVSIESSIGVLGFCAGYGYTARDAYTDWRKRWDKANT